MRKNKYLSFKVKKIYASSSRRGKKNKNKTFLCTQARSIFTRAKKGKDLMCIARRRRRQSVRTYVRKKERGDQFLILFEEKTSFSSSPYASEGKNGEIKEIPPSRQHLLLAAPSSLSLSFTGQTSERANE